MDDHVTSAESTSEKTYTGLPHFESPPVVEVACCVVFERIDALLTPHVGKLWTRFETDFPGCEETMPLLTLANLATLDKPLLPRVWFTSLDETRVIQVQRDRFTYNWRQKTRADVYPRYRKLVEEYRQRLGTFLDFVAEVGGAEPKPVGVELTYVNQVPIDPTMSARDNFHRVLPDFSWRDDSSRYLPVPESINWTTTFLMEQGRLHLNVKAPAVSPVYPSTSVIAFDWTARGTVQGHITRDEIFNWLELAHVWIVRGFEDITGEYMRRAIWKQILPAQGTATQGEGGGH